MTNRAEFERLLDVYGFRCERFGQDLSTHARAQVVSAFAALASAPVAGEANSTSWQDAFRISELPEVDEVLSNFANDSTGDNAVGLVQAILNAAPQASEAVPQPLIARALAEWHEYDGPVTWWAWCGHEWAGEAPWCGTPLDQEWPGYHTHWTPIPGVPAALSAQPSGNPGELAAQPGAQKEQSE